MFPLARLGKKRKKNARLCIVEFFSWLTRLIQRPRSKGSLSNQNYLEFHQTFRCDFHGLWNATHSCFSVLPRFPWNCGWKRESWYLVIASIKMYQLFTHGLIRSSPLWLGHFAILSFKKSNVYWVHFPHPLGVATDSTHASTEFGFAVHGHYAWGAGNCKAPNTGSFWDFSYRLYTFFGGLWPRKKGLNLARKNP